MISSASPASHHEWESKASLVEYIAADRIACPDSLSLSYVGFCSSDPSETGFPGIHVKRYLYPHCRVRNISFGAFFSAASCTHAHTTRPQSPNACSSGTLLLNTSSISPFLSLLILHSLTQETGEPAWAAASLPVIEALGPVDKWDAGAFRLSVGESGDSVSALENLSLTHKHKQKPHSPVTITHLIATGHRQVLRHVSSSADSLAPVPCPSLITHGYSSAKRWAIWKAVGSRSAATTITPGTDCRMAFEWPPAPKVKSRTTCWKTKKQNRKKKLNVLSMMKTTFSLNKAA